MLQKLYSHSSISTAVMCHANLMSKDADASLDKAINF